MKRTFALVLQITTLIFISLRASSQEDPNKYKVSLSGFVRADAIFDSRQVLEAREGFLLFYPKKPQLDPNGEDIHAKPTFNQYAMTTRLTAKATGPDVLGAKVLALIEGDFTGASNAENNSMRLRHAYISLQWTKTRLLVGQYWHPLDLPEMIPNVLSLNTGAPFHSFSRQPQVRLDHKAGKFNFVAVASSQRDYVNNGPQGNTSVYLRNSVVPNLHGQVHYKNGNLFAGLAVDYKMLTPRLSTDSLYDADESLNCLSYSGFLSYKNEIISVKAQYTFGQALNDHLMMGGFGVTSRDESTDHREYSPLNYQAAWMNSELTLGKWIPSVLLGYTQNMGSAEILTGPVYARDADIDYVYRIAPMITYVTGKFSLILEVEYTVAAYGTNDEYYKVLNSTETGNVRIGVGLVYSF
ncbi:MAG: hypothetical protein AB9834_24100 [Lentimicrobium sp.]